MEFLSQALRELGFLLMSPSAHQPINSITFARDNGGRFGFLEAATLEDAATLLKLDGIKWRGAALMIRRISDTPAPDRCTLTAKCVM